MGNSTSRVPQSTNKTSQSPLSTMEDSQPLPTLPQEIIHDILLRLPVKSLLRLRCVCKSWHTLISNPKFAKTHLRQASMNTNFRNHRLILWNLYPLYDVKSCSLYSLLNEKSASAVELDFAVKAPEIRIKIWGCCDGLVCMGTSGVVFIWNPSTRKYKLLPNVEMSGGGYTRFEFGYPCGDARFGFGYDDCIDDYKVVGFFYDGFANVFSPKLRVYALRSDSWRRIGDCPHLVPPDARGIFFVNRALHWAHLSPRICDCLHCSGSNIIVSLDLVKETYGEVSIPDYRDADVSDMVLGVLNGCLCIICKYYDGLDVSHVWVMKEYGIRDSWTKLVIIPWVSDWLAIDTTPICIMENGDVLLNICEHLVRCTPKDDTVSYLDIRNCSPRYNAHPYVESLVSLDFHAVSANTCTKWSKLRIPTLEDFRRLTWMLTEAFNGNTNAKGNQGIENEEI